MYDAVVLGSGLGGLTCGAFLARAGKKVCVLEEHYRIGGYAHSFKRRGYTFESGIHSVPMGANGMVMHLLTLLGVEKRVRPFLQKEMFSFSSPDFCYTVPVHRQSIRESLMSDFPGQRRQLTALFDEMMTIYDALVRPIFSYEDRFVEEDREFIARYYSLSYHDFIARHIDDPRLRAIFFAQWPYGGMLPSQAPTIFYTVMFLVHFLEGSHYCEGGFATLADALASAITTRGGDVLTRSRVTGLVTENDRVVLAQTGKGEEIRGRLFISNISPYRLHREIIPPQARNRMWLRRLENLRPSISAVSVYCGVRGDIPGMEQNNIVFRFEHESAEKMYRSLSEGSGIIDDHLILLKGAEQPVSTLTLLTFCRAGREKEWKQAKREYGESMLRHAEKQYPGLKEVVDLVEYASPRTFERYTGNTDGALYGFENTRDIYGEAKLPSKTYLSNLYQTGHWGKPGGGVWNVMVNGYTTALSALSAGG